MRVITAMLVLVASLVTQAAFAGGYDGKEPVRVVHAHRHFRLCGPPPPSGPILESVAVRRVPLDMETSFQIRQEAGRLAPERERSCGTDSRPQSESGAVSSVRQVQIEAFDQRLTKVEADLARMFGLLERQHKLISDLYPPEQ